MALILQIALGVAFGLLIVWGFIAVWNGIATARAAAYLRRHGSVEASRRPPSTSDDKGGERAPRPESPEATAERERNMRKARRDRKQAEIAAYEQTDRGR